MEIIKKMKLSIPFKWVAITAYAILIAPIIIFFFGWLRWYWALIPTVLIQGIIALELIQNSKIKQDKIFIITVLLAVCFSGNYYAVFRGYIDIALLTAYINCDVPFY